MESSCRLARSFHRPKSCAFAVLNGVFPPLWRHAEGEKPASLWPLPRQRILNPCSTRKGRVLYPSNPSVCEPVVCRVSDEGEHGQIWPRAARNSMKSGVSKSETATKPLQAKAHLSFEVFPTVGKGVGIPYEPSSETDFLLKWVCRWFTSLHQFLSTTQNKFNFSSKTRLVEWCAREDLNL